MILLIPEDEIHNVYFGLNYIYNTIIFLFRQCFNFKNVKILSILYLNKTTTVSFVGYFYLLFLYCTCILIIFIFSC